MKRRKRSNYEILLSGEFFGFSDIWTEYLCMEKHADGSVTLTSRAHQILGESGRYRNRYGDINPPNQIKGKRVWGTEGGYVLGENLLLHDGLAEVVVPLYETDIAAQWLKQRKWDRQPGFEQAWERIRNALSGPVTQGKGNRKARPATEPSSGDRNPREIVIRCEGMPARDVLWLEILCVELDPPPAGRFHIYKRIRRTGHKRADKPELVATVPKKLTWREVLKFVDQWDEVKVHPGFGEHIDVSGVRPWQRDVITASLMSLQETVAFLSKRSDPDLEFLYGLLGSFLPEEAAGRLRQLRRVISQRPFKGRSLRRIASDTDSRCTDLDELLDDIYAYFGECAAEAALSRYDGTAAVPSKVFLEVIRRQRTKSVSTRTGLFELWLRTDHKPTGGAIYPGMYMDDELPVLHWILSDSVDEIFAALFPYYADSLQQFVVWFLEQARFRVKLILEASSFTVYAFGIPRYQAWVQLGLEIESAANEFGIPFPVSLMPMAEPALEAGGGAILMIE